MDSQELARKTAHLNTLLEQKLGLRKGGLAARANRAGRDLPAWVRRNLQQLAEAETMASHPKLARMLDGQALEKAYTAAAAHLADIDPRERRKDRLLGLLGGLAFNMLLFAALVLALLRWQGFI
ncbi:hypothetical protein M8756_05220 [Lutimaribacter sp. EGI FJ00015]|uniref:Uncharacterized protein n=1 Tax=Lutimaribacter degradans TaxID=2945989 RepID=A0ACC5ZUS0_9RHOB|nr:hypothetical protein [Lutimaribacter sp. EGI FJ00013]MCM2561590.1 hypothetical protein [Lutimaribacter sp. EGI FJ00013]MCO0612699.1 hypothetical protein [Lutimaribacter sp. EGI FJ00015]MCO0635357.1 hypothetical protein [Lutimaribacter sp. EGI FJ00014]